MEDNSFPPNEKLYDLTRLEEMSRGNDAFVKRMIQIFADRIPGALEQIKEAYDHKNFKAIRDIAHLLKPGIDNMGITAIKTDIRSIENLALTDPSSPMLLNNINKINTVLMQVFHLLMEELK